MSKQTALQELIEIIDSEIKSHQRYGSYDSGRIDGLNKAKNLAEQKLPIEREQIIDAYGEGYHDCFSDNSHITGNDYFTTTFKDG